MVSEYYANNSWIDVHNKYMGKGTPSLRRDTRTKDWVYADLLGFIDLSIVDAALHMRAFSETSVGVYLRQGQCQLFPCTLV